MHRFPDQHFPSAVCPRLEVAHPLDACGDLTAVKTCTTDETGGEDGTQDHVFRCQYRNKSRSGLTLRAAEAAIPFLGAVPKIIIRGKTVKSTKNTVKTPKFTEKSFYGGCLSHENYAAGNCAGILFHPRQPDLNGLLMVPVSLSSEKKNIFTQSPYLEHKLSEPLLQIETTPSTDNGGIIAALRTPTQCHLVNITGKGGKPKLSQTHIKCKQKPTSISLSPYIKGECLISHADGSMQLNDIDRRVLPLTPEWQDNGQACWSHFGSHPRLVVAHQPKELYLFDIRSSRTSSAQTCLMTLPNELLARNQEIQVTRQHPVNYFYHLVATQDMIVLLDERFPKYNVLQWSHCLQSSPCCLNIINKALPTDDLAIVSSYSSGQVHCVQFSCLDGSTPMSTSSLWKLSPTSSWLDTMSHLPTCHGVDDIINSRLCEPLIGTCTAQHTDGKQLTVFQISQAGDMFQQRLFPSDQESSADKTAIPGPGFNQSGLSEESQQICRRWLNKAILDGRKDTAQKRRHQSVIEVPRTLILQELKVEPHPDCTLCSMKQTESHSVPKTPKLQDNITCPACGLPVKSAELADYFKTIRTSTNFAAGILTSRVGPSLSAAHVGKEKLPWKPVKYSQYKDALGGLLRKDWHFDGDEDDNVDGDDEQLADTDDQTSSQMTQMTCTPATATSSAAKAPATAPKRSTKPMPVLSQPSSASIPVSRLHFPDHLVVGQPKVTLTRLKKLPAESSATSSLSPKVPQSLVNFLEASRQSSLQGSIVSTPRSPQKRITARRKLLNRNYTIGF